MLHLIGLAIGDITQKIESYRCPLMHSAGQRAALECHRHLAPGQDR